MQARDKLVVAVDYSFYVGGLDSNYRPVTRVNGYVKSTSVAQCYMSVKYLSDVSDVVYVTRFYGPDGTLADERTGKGNPRKAGESSTWSFPTDKVSKVQNNIGIWRLELYLGTHLVFMECFTVGDYFFNISVTGLPSSFTTRVVIDGEEGGSIRGGETKATALINGSHTISVNDHVEASSELRYACGNCSLTVSSEGSHTFEYSEEKTAQTRIGTESITNKCDCIPTGTIALFDHWSACCCGSRDISCSSIRKEAQG